MKARSLWRLEPLRIRWAEFRSICYLSPFLPVSDYIFYSFFSTSTILLFFHSSSFCFLVPFFLFLSPPMCPFFPLPSCDLMLGCGLAFFLFLCLPPSFSLLLSFDPSYFTASRGCSFPYFFFVKITLCHIILTLVRSDFPQKDIIREMFFSYLIIILPHGMLDN